jgi:hypothetical protein
MKSADSDAGRRHSRHRSSHDVRSCGRGWLVCGAVIGRCLGRVYEQEGNAPSRLHCRWRTTCLHSLHDVGFEDVGDVAQNVHAARFVLIVELRSDRTHQVSQRSDHGERVAVSRDNCVRKIAYQCAFFQLRHRSNPSWSLRMAARTTGMGCPNHSRCCFEPNGAEVYAYFVPLLFAESARSLVRFNG